MRCLHLRCAAHEKGYRRRTTDRRLGETKVKIFKIGPLHINLEKEWSEPCWVRKTASDTDRKAL
jgi:hypothetical protein